MIEALQWACVFAIAAPHVLYPALLWARAAFAPRPFRSEPSAGVDWPPRVDLVIAAHDEAASIGARIANVLALDHPPDRLRLWIASDGSTDETVAIARGFDDPRVHVLDLPRGGKAAALSAAVEASARTPWPAAEPGAAPSTEANGGAEILAFSDANSAWRRDALRELIAPFADPEVGGVAGNQCYAPAGAAEDGSADAIGDAALGERSHWQLDRFMKRWQSRAGNAISATGAIHAIRRELFEPPPPDATDDFTISTGVIARGRRLVFAERAIAVEPPAPAAASEFRRKVRILTRGLRAVAHRRALLNPARTGFYAFELLLQKLWRRLAWIPLAILVLSAPFTPAEAGLAGWIARAAFAGTALGVLGLVSPALARRRPVALATFVVMVNAACAVATWNALRGRRVARWEPERVEPPTGAPAHDAPAGETAP